MKNILKPSDYLERANYKNCIWDFCGNFYRSFLSNNITKDIKLQNFVLLLQWSGKSDESLAIDNIFPKDAYQKATTDVLPVVKKIVDNLVSENLDEDKFYKELFTKICDDILFTEEIEIICAITALILNPKIPYFKLGKAVTMDNDEYQEISLNLHREISKAYFVLQYGYAQKTELASQLYDIVKAQKQDEERIVLIANILGFYNSQMKILYDKLKEHIQSNEDIED